MGNSQILSFQLFSKQAVILNKFINREGAGTAGLHFQAGTEFNDNYQVFNLSFDCPFGSSIIVLYPSNIMCIVNFAKYFTFNDQTYKKSFFTWVQNKPAVKFILVINIQWPDFDVLNMYFILLYFQ